MTNHPTLTRCILAARKINSTASTPRGLKRVLAGRSIIDLLPKAPVTRRVFTQLERDSRRLKHDHKFARRLEREAAALTNLPMVSSVVEYLTIESHRRKRALELQQVLGRKLNICARPANGCDLGYDSDLFRSMGGRLPNGSAREWSSTWKPTDIIDFNGSWYFSDSGREAYGYSRYHAQYWKPGEHSIAVESWCLINPHNPRSVTVHYHIESRTWVLPCGFRWDIDQNGLRLVDRLGDDYHPTLTELFSVGCVETCITQYSNGLEARRAARIEREKNERSIATADKRGVRVGMLDSLAAGNCEQGTRNFAARHGLDPSKWYRPADLLKIANGDAQRVRLTIAVAVKRHDTWAEAGAEVFYPKS